MANGDCVCRTDEIDHFVMAITAAEAMARHLARCLELIAREELRCSPPRAMCFSTATPSKNSGDLDAYDSLDMRQPCGWLPNCRAVCG